MKKFILIAASAAFLTACNSEDRSETTIENRDSIGVATDNTYVAPESTTYTPAEGDVTYRNGKVMVYRNNNFVEADNDVTLNDGITVRRSGEVTRTSDGKVYRLEEGETVDRSGNFFNKTGEGLEDAWDASKKGVTKAAGAVKKAGQKVGEAAKSIVD